MSGHFSSLLATPPDTIDSERVPVTVLTGFLGSGKTTLLNRLLQLPDLQGTAVIVNEFGAIGIDHDLVTATSEDTVLLANGCLCCVVRGDLVEALLRLAERPAGSLRQVLIETSGLANPGPILRTLMGEPAVRSRFTLAGVACTVDAVLGLGTLEREAEAAQQVALADALFLTKTDLLPGPLPQAAPVLLARLAQLNPGAMLHGDRADQALELRTLTQAGRKPLAGDGEAAPFYRLAARTGSIGDTLGSTFADTGTDAPGAPGSTDAPAPHGKGIRSFVIVRDHPLPRAGFAAWLDMVTAMRGEDLLRVKGIVQLAEQPDQPLVFHGVQHLFHPPETLAAWPGPDRRTRIVFITRGVDAQAMDDALSVMARRPRLRATTPTPPPPHNELTETP